MNSRKLNNKYEMMVTYQEYDKEESLIMLREDEIKKDAPKHIF